MLDSIAVVAATGVDDVALVSLATDELGAGTRPSRRSSPASASACSPATPCWPGSAPPLAALLLAGVAQETTDAPDGSVDVADPGTSGVQRFDRNGAYRTDWAVETPDNQWLGNPVDVAPDADGVWVIDQRWGKLRRDAPSGEPTMPGGPRRRSSPPTRPADLPRSPRTAGAGAGGPAARVTGRR